MDTISQNDIVLFPNLIKGSELCKTLNIASGSLSQYHKKGMQPVKQYITKNGQKAYLWDLKQVQEWLTTNNVKLAILKDQDYKLYAQISSSFVKLASAEKKAYDTYMSLIDKNAPGDQITAARVNWTEILKALRFLKKDLKNKLPQIQQPQIQQIPKLIESSNTHSEHTGLSIEDRLILLEEIIKTAEPNERLNAIKLYSILKGDAKPILNAQGTEIMSVSFVEDDSIPTTPQTPQTPQTPLITQIPLIQPTIQTQNTIIESSNAFANACSEVIEPIELEFTI